VNGPETRPRTVGADGGPVASPTLGGGLFDGLVYRGEPGEHPQLRIRVVGGQELAGRAQQRPGRQGDEEHLRVVR